MNCVQSVPSWLMRSSQEESTAGIEIADQVHCLEQKVVAHHAQDIERLLEGDLPSE